MGFDRKNCGVMENLQGFETWFFGSLISLTLLIIGYFLKRNFEKLEATQKEHEDSINDHETRIRLQEAGNNSIGETLKRTNELLAKLRDYNQ